MNISIHLQMLAVLSAVLLISACSNNQSTFIAAAQDAEKGSVVYIYRPSSSTNFMMSPGVLIDGNEEFRIGSGDYRYVYLQPGLHTVGLNPTEHYITDAVQSIQVEDSTSYYLRVKTSLKFEPEKMNTRKFWIDVVDENDALREIGDTEYAGPEIRQSATVQADETGHREGFSVDRTQDPFAGKYE